MWGQLIGKVVTSLLGSQDDGRRTPENLNKVTQQLNEEILNMKQDNGFYGHDKVPGMKQDKSGWAKL